MLDANYYVLAFEGEGRLAEFLEAFRSFLKSPRSARYRASPYPLAVWARVDSGKTEWNAYLYMTAVAMQAAAAAGLEALADPVDWVSPDQLPPDAVRIVRPGRDVA